MGYIYAINKTSRMASIYALYEIKAKLVKKYKTIKLLWNKLVKID